MRNNHGDYEFLNNNGFSLAELLIVLALIGVMGVYVSSVYLFSEQSVNQWRNSLSLQNEYQALMNGIIEDIYKAEALVGIDNHALKLELPGGVIRTYEKENGNLVRNDKPLNKQDVHVSGLAFKWKYRPGSPDKSIGKNDLVYEEITFIEVKLSLAVSKDTLVSARAVRLRNPLMWASLEQ